MVENPAVPRLTIVEVCQVTAVAKQDSKTSLLIDLKIRVDRQLCGLLIVAGLALAQNRSTGDTPTPVTTYSAVKTARTVQLQDATTVVLNKGSVLKVRITAAARDIELPHGEALFRVTPDPARPFRVAAGDVSVQVLGTVFLINQPAPGRTEVLVTQGQVAVSLGEGVLTKIDAGAGLRIQRDTAAGFHLAPDELDERLEWANPLAEYKVREVAEIVRTLNEFNDTQLVIADPRIAHLSIAGSILGLTEPAAFAESLRDIYNIRARTDRGKDGPKVIRLYAGERAPKRR